MAEHLEPSSGSPSRNGVLADPPPPPSGGFLRGLRQVLVTALARLRFVAILGVIGVVITQWDTIAAHYAKWTRPAGGEAGADPDHEYFCPMHPTVVRDNNKEKCPICFMPLSKRKKGEASDVALPAGTVSRVQLSPYRVVLAGVRTVPADYLPLTKDVRTVGTVEFDERGLKQVAARFKARIEKLHVNQTGQRVKKGDPLAELYSPDLVVTARNLLDARKAGNAGLETMARDRLRLWGIGDEEVQAIIAAGEAPTRLTVRSPIDGHVIRKYQTEGRYVDEGTALYDVADLNTVWIQAQVYEDDLAFLPADDHGHHGPVAAADRVPVTATTLAYPGEEFRGGLSFVFPHIDQETRTLTVRYELDNPGHKLKPGMTATVTLRITPDRLAAQGGAFARFRRPAGGVPDALPALVGSAAISVPPAPRILAVPEASVIDTGTQKVVYRQALPGEFEGVLVELGPRMAGPGGAPYYPVLAGLEPGDVVVAAGSFLIDAETRLNPAAGSIYIGGSGGGGGKGGAVTAVRPTTPDDPEAKTAAAFAKLPPADRKLAEEQKYCPILEGSRLGSMGVPVKLMLDGKPVFVCCPGCEPKAKKDPAGTAARADELRRKGPSAPPPAKPAGPSAEDEAEIRDNLAKLPPADRKLAEEQKYCPDTGERLGSMGVPIKLDVKGRPVFVCCKGCDKRVRADPDKALKLVDEFKAGNPPQKK